MTKCIKAEEDPLSLDLRLPLAPFVEGYMVPLVAFVRQRGTAAE